LSKLKDKNCVEDQTAKFEIELNASDLGDRLQWFKNDQEIDPLKDENFEIKAIGDKYYLIVKKARFEDDADYSVKIRDTDKKSTAHLSIEEAPLEFVRPLHDQELKENQKATFECELNKPGEKVKWFRNDQPIESDDPNVKIEVDGKIHRLVLKKINADDAARYYAKVPAGGPSCSASLYVEEIPVEFIHKISNVTVKEKETATFTCQLNKENAQVKWFKAGLEILPTDNKYKYITDGSRYSLQINDCQLDDANDYTIFYRGRKCVAHLEVEGFYFSSF
jgi:titin